MPDDTRTPEERIAALEAEIASLRKPAPKPDPLYRTLDGQGSVQFDRGGNRVVPPLAPDNTTVGANGGFGSVWREGPNGDRQWCPDGLPRNPATGEVISASAGASTGSIGEGPHRTAQHQMAIDQLDRAFPVTRNIPSKE